MRTIAPLQVVVLHVGLARSFAYLLRAGSSRICTALQVRLGGGPSKKGLEHPQGQPDAGRAGGGFTLGPGPNCIGVEVNESHRHQGGQRAWLCLCPVWQALAGRPLGVIFTWSAYVRSPQCCWRSAMYRAQASPTVQAAAAFLRGGGGFLPCLLGSPRRLCFRPARAPARAGRCPRPAARTGAGLRCAPHRCCARSRTLPMVRRIVAPVLQALDSKTKDFAPFGVHPNA